jgi:group II intron reverse transcriptase/maturase
LQITLYRKAKSSPGYRFWSLYGEVQRADVLETAWRRVKANGGVAGVDGEEIADIAAEKEKEAAWLEALREELRGKTYRPAPVLRAEIAKAGGGVRKLGIPTVKDRVVQMAVYLVLMPIFEADFHPSSFGYRPGRGAHEAVEAIRQGLRSGRTEVVDADLAQYFDTIPHGKLMRLVARRVSDGTILKLIKAWLRAPIVEEEEGGGRRMKANPCGTPQGGVISPLLANIYLHPLDEEVNEQCRQKPWMIRFADDLVILCGSGQGVGMKERLARWLQSRGLALNEKKTQVVQSRESGFAFLGFSFRWQQSRKKTAYVHIEPSPEAEQALRDRVRELTSSRSVWRATEEVVREINQVTRGWGNYFALAQYHRSFGQLNTFVAHRLRQWLWRKHGNPCGKYERWPNRELFTQCGLYQMPTPCT